MIRHLGRVKNFPIILCVLVVIKNIGDELLQNTFPLRMNK